MAKNKSKTEYVIKIVKAFELSPDKKYLLVVPKTVYNHPQLGPALLKFLESNKYLAVVMDNPNEIKLLEVPDENATGKTETNKK